MSKDNLTDEDKDLFRQMMKTVKPLKHTQKAVFKEPLIYEKKYNKINNSIINHDNKSHKEDVSKKTRALQFNLSNYSQDTVNSDSILIYTKSSISRKQLIKLRNGQISLQAQLDLHGLTEESAKDTLCEFIIKQYSLGNRSLLIIHGKGSKHGEAPILKNLINNWLRQIPEILAFHSALGRDGGSGAVYVLLKRK